MEDELELEFENLHPWLCPCKLCEDEMIAQGMKPLQSMPVWVLKQAFPVQFCLFQTLGFYD